jgi:hypothetical protein
MTAKTPANSIAEIVAKLEAQNETAKMQINFLNDEIRINSETIDALAPLAEWVSTPTPEPIDETNTGETK